MCRGWCFAPLAPFPPLAALPLVVSLIDFTPLPPVSWLHDGRHIRYTFYIRRSNETAFQEVEISANDATSYVADGLAIATDYTIALSASDPDGEGLLLCCFACPVSAVV